MDIITQLNEFIFSKQYWDYHGFVLSGLWVLVSAVAILAKKLNTTFHVFLFVMVDLLTIFFATTAIYRVSYNVHTFFEWSPLKQCHVIGGNDFLT